MREHAKQLTSIDARIPALYSLVNKKWRTEFLDIYYQLKNWEIDNVGELQFTNCFSSVANFLEFGPKH